MFSGETWFNTKFILLFFLIFYIFEQGVIIAEAVRGNLMEAFVFSEGSRTMLQKP